MAKSWSMELDVVGIGFRMDKEKRAALKAKVNIESIDYLKLEREPSNQYDPNAIKVNLPDGTQLGYLRRDTAELLAPKLDNGALRVRSVTLTDLTPEPHRSASGKLLITFEDMKPVAKRMPVKKAVSK